MDSNTSDSDFAARWIRVQRMVFSFILAAIPDFHEAEDVLQKVGMKAFEMRQRYDPAASKYSTWVIGIARNEIRAARRSSQRDRLIFDDEVFGAIADAAGATEARLSETQEALIECMRGIQGRGRQLLQMRYRDSMRSRDIAEQLHTTEAVVNVTLQRVRTALFNCINDRIGEREVSL